MLLLALRELMSRRTATLLAGAGLLTATLGFMVLASTSNTADAVLTGDIGKAWATPYDLLIRPPGSETTLEASAGLVRPNFLSGLSGGITEAQLEGIRGIPGVLVAAPIAVAGLVMVPTQAPVDLTSLAGTNPISVFRVGVTVSGEAGLSHYPGETAYFVVTPSGTEMADQGKDLVLHDTLAAAGRTITCSPVPNGAPQDVTCEAPHEVCKGYTAGPKSPSGGPVDCTRSYAAGLPPGRLGTAAFMLQPLVIAGIDPVAEAALAGLDRCVTTGRYLSATDAPTPQKDANDPAYYTSVPVLASDRSFLDEQLNIQVAKAQDPSAVFNGAYMASQAQGWATVAQTSLSATDVYRAFLDSSSGLISGFSNLWTPESVSYLSVGGDALVAQVQEQNPAAFENVGAGASNAPPEAQDTWFRQLGVRKIINGFQSGDGPPAWQVVGRYNPDCIPGFNPLAGGGMDAYSSPQVQLPNGQALGPTANVAGYINSPPLLLTTMAGAQLLAQPNRYQGGPGPKFISTIRVRVAGTAEPGPVAEARLARVAAEIHAETGLLVDIIKGSSPKAIGVQLAAGKFGRPPLTVTEGWSVKGVGFRFLKAVSAQNLALFGLVLAGAMVLVGETGYIAVRRRRREFGVLRGLGWRASSVAWLVELEMLLLGIGAGLVALVAGVPIVSRLGLGTSSWQLAAIVPMAVAIAALAGLVPALSAARGTTAAAMGSTGDVAITSRQPPNGLIGVAWREMRGQWRAEGLLGAAAIALGAAILGVVVLISLAFRGQLDTTVLGTYLSGEVRPFHLVLAGLTLIVGAIAAAEVVTLSYLERRSHLGALRALGWPAWAVVKLLAIQATLIGVAGGVVSALVVLAAGILLQASYAAIGWGLLAAVGMTFVATAIAVAAPLTLAYRANPADALRGE